MKTLITDYTFDAAAKTVTFLGTVPTMEQLQLITNVTKGEIIYHFADPSTGGTLAGNVLTLECSTTGMSNTDHLQIFAYINTDDLRVFAYLDESEFQESLLYLARLILKSTSYARDNSDRMRVIMDNNPMLYTYMRNSGTGMSASTEPYYSISSWNVVDAREQLAAIQNGIVSAAIQRWRVV